MHVGLTQPLFGDEISSIFFARSNTYAQLFSERIEVIHPNTYYILVKALLDIGTSVTGLRLVQVGIFFASIFPLIGVFRLLSYSKWKVFAGVTVWLWSAYFLQYSYLIRMYGLAITGVVSSMYFAMRFIRKPVLSRFLALVVIDLFGISLVTGYWIWVLVQYAAVLWCMYKSSRIRWMKRVGVTAALWLIVFGATAYNALQANAAVTVQHLYWVPIPRLSDVVSMSAVLLGLASSSYFEAYSADPPRVITLLVFCAFGILAAVLWKKGKETTRTALQRYFNAITVCSLCVYAVIFLVCFVLKLPYFHVRQLFPVAVVFLLAAVNAFYILFRFRRGIALGVALPLLFLGMRRTVISAFGQNPIYPQRYEQMPQGIPVFYTRSDIELIYDACAATSFTEMEEKCKDDGMFLVESSDDVMRQFEEFGVGEVALTATAKGHIDESVHWTCTQLSVDYYRCQWDE